MRSLRVVLPESMWALIPMFRNFSSFIFLFHLNSACHFLGPRERRRQFELLIVFHVPSGNVPSGNVPSGNPTHDKLSDCYSILVVVRACCPLADDLWLYRHVSLSSFRMQETERSDSAVQSSDSLATPLTNPRVLHPEGNCVQIPRL